MTVKIPDGAPEAIRRVAVRVKVDVLVMVVVHGGAVGVAGEFPELPMPMPMPIPLLPEDMRHEQADAMRSESKGASPYISSIRQCGDTIWPIPHGIAG
jgi:hypothetical protein